MGAGVAQVAAQAGIEVLILSEVSEELCRRGVDDIGRNLDRMVERGRIKPEERGTMMRPRQDHHAASKTSATSIS